MRIILSQNAHRLIRTKHFDALLNEDTKTWLKCTAGQRDAKLLGLKNDYARALWRCKQSTWIPKAAHNQAACLVEFKKIHLQGKQRWFRPIATLSDVKKTNFNTKMPVALIALVATSQHSIFTGVSPGPALAQPSKIG
jgi:hypothetical protein